MACLHRGIVWSKVMSDEKPIYRTHIWEGVYDTTYDRFSHKKCMTCGKEWHFMIDPPSVGPCTPV